MNVKHNWQEHNGHEAFCKLGVIGMVNIISMGIMGMTNISFDKVLIY